MSSARAVRGKIRSFGRAASMHGYARRPDWGIGSPRSTGVRKGSVTRSPAGAPRTCSLASASKRL